MPGTHCLRPLFTLPFMDLHLLLSMAFCACPLDTTLHHLPHTRAPAHTHHPLLLLTAALSNYSPPLPLSLLLLQIISADGTSWLILSGTAKGSGRRIHWRTHALPHAPHRHTTHTPHCPHPHHTHTTTPPHPHIPHPTHCPHTHTHCTWPPHHCTPPHHMDLPLQIHAVTSIRAPPGILPLLSRTHSISYQQAPSAFLGSGAIAGRQRAAASCCHYRVPSFLPHSLPRSHLLPLLHSPPAS